MPSRHSPETIGTALMLLAGGGVLLYLSHRWGVGMDLMSGIGAVMGPVGVALGVGMMIHGKAMPPTHVSLAARCWGTCGSLEACWHLLYRGYFEHRAATGVARSLMPLVLVLVWWLPGRFYGPEPGKPVEDVEIDGPDPKA